MFRNQTISAMSRVPSAASSTILGSVQDNQNSYAGKEEYVARHPEFTQLVEVLEFV
jgi:hypothetical protein